MVASRRGRLYKLSLFLVLALFVLMAAGCDGTLTFDDRYSEGHVYENGDRIKVEVTDMNLEFVMPCDTDEVRLSFWRLPEDAQDDGNYVALARVEESSPWDEAIPLTVSGAKEATGPLPGGGTGTYYYVTLETTRGQDAEWEGGPRDTYVPYSISYSGDLENPENEKLEAGVLGLALYFYGEEDKGSGCSWTVAEGLTTRITGREVALDKQKSDTEWHLVPGEDAPATLTVYVGDDFDGEHSVYVPGRVMFPLRYVAEAFGADVAWEADTRTAVVTLNGKTARLQPGSAKVYVDGELRIWNLPVELRNGHTYVAVGTLTDLFDLWVAWLPDRTATFGPQ